MGPSQESSQDSILARDCVPRHDTPGSQSGRANRAISGNSRVSRGPRLCGEADRGVGGAVSLVAALPLHDLEEEAIGEGLGIELEVLAGVVPVVKQARCPEPVEELRRKTEPALRGRRSSCRARRAPRCRAPAEARRREDIGAREGDVLHPRAEEFREESAGKRAVALRRRSAQSAPSVRGSRRPGCAQGRRGRRHRPAACGPSRRSRCRREARRASRRIPSTARRDRWRASAPSGRLPSASRSGRNSISHTRASALFGSVK